MRAPQLTLLAAIFCSTPLLARAQETHEVDLLVSNRFEPATLTIEVGDTVRWDWVGGRHNVVNGEGPPGAQDDGEIFDSGLPTGDTGTVFEHTFEEEGVFPYYSEPDFFFNMRGVITVVPATGGEGEGEGEPGVCSDLNDVQDQLAAFRTAVSAEDDIDGDGVPDEFGLALVEFAACNVLQTSAALRDRTQEAIASNLELILDQADAKGLALDVHPELLAALSTISENMQDALDDALEDPLPAGLEVVTIEHDAGVVSAFAGTGDFDGDGMTNAREYLSAVLVFGEPDLGQYIAFATRRPLLGDDGGCAGEDEDDENTAIAVPPSFFGDAFFMALALAAIFMAGRLSRRTRLVEA